MNVFNFVSSGIDRLSRVFLAAFMAVLITIVLFGVINRFIFKFSYSWMDEAARYLMIWSCMLGSAIALRSGFHIGIVFLISKLDQNKFWLMLLNYSLVIIFLFIVTIYGAKLSVSQMSRLSPTLGISMFWALISIPTGSFIMIIHSFSLMNSLFQEYKQHEEV